MAAPTSVPVINALTVDVEDYFHVQAFAGVISRDDWDRLPCRVEANTDRMLAQFEAAGVKATMFTLGWVAERYPQVIRRIVAAGHELASHGHGHARVDGQTPEVFRADIRRAKHVLEDIGVRCFGRGGPSIQLQRLSCASRPLRHPGCATVSPSSEGGSTAVVVVVGTADDDGEGVWPQHSLFRRRLFPAGAL
jgi:hypothetical protein